MGKDGYWSTLIVRRRPVRVTIIYGASFHFGFRLCGVTILIEQSACRLYALDRETDRVMAEVCRL